MNLEAEARGDLLVVRVQEERIDAASAIQFKDRMRELVAAPCPRVLLDLSRVTFLDSSGLGAVVSVMKLLGPDRRLELAALGPVVQKVFRLTRMDRVFTIHERVSDAL
ncbi:STAS domain-containing protein [Cereibacter azotoformans]|uniref:Anti-sigma factor antagonist n=1 Tax=Cereibacter azotoformans TaxID=43057 RepID=A0A2T5JV29_9RHOB|nr:MULTISPECIES: STAS domain-containing protein [Cereibacter]AXQ94720.1 anti-sigma factor antagonist [Cereibacter sphaeroides]MBO4170424.1 STAS domain-containing protein [Cereibacter azotoformans]PTR14017.1 anti-sigma B factor antagonist [Cereibacter azotoformans]UIJ30288.1 STAS domain-containing protein [Cereibacter azotoformans]